MEDNNDIDIYADLPKYRFNDGIDTEELQASNKTLNEKVIQLTESLAKVTREKDEYQTKCATLTTNISSLLKTAQAEIKRKDRLIEELRAQIADSKQQNRSIRKRTLPSDNEPLYGKRSKITKINSRVVQPSADFPGEENQALRNTLQENKISATALENKNSSPNSKKNIKISRNLDDGESTAICRETPVVLPNRKCETLYSQRMLKKIIENEKENQNQFESREKPNLPPENSINSRTDDVGSDSVCKQPNEINKEVSKSSEVNKPKPPNGIIKLNSSSDISCCTVNSSNEPAKTNAASNENNVTNKPNNTKELIQSATLTKCNKDEVNALHSAGCGNGIVNVVANNSLKKIPTVDNGDNARIVGYSQRAEEREQFFRSLNHSSQIKIQNLEKSTTLLATNDPSNNDSSKFVRPTTSRVPKRPCNKNMILPISNCWNGLVKTVDPINIRKEPESVCASKNPMTDINLKDEIGFAVEENKPNEDFTKTDREIVSVTDANNGKASLIENLFGSPLKWTESSNEESTPALELTPAVYEDSCSAHIENIKFNLSSENPQGAKNINKPSVQNKIIQSNSESERSNKLTSSNNATVKQNISIITDKSIRAFQDVGYVKQKVKSIFSPLKNSDSCKSPASSVLNLNRDSPIDLSLNFPFRSTYEDSVLGQFDDTTQFVSALTKIESKISPLNTPVKSVVEPIKSVNNTVNETLRFVSTLAKSETPITQTEKQISPNKSLDSNSINALLNDTTRFVSALTKVESKISPINTPAKSIEEIKSLSASKPSITDSTSNIFSKVNVKLGNNEITKINNPFSKSMSEKPINILYPRKTPRIVSRTKSATDTGNKNTSTANQVNDNQSKINRIAINDAFICQQEEKVLRNSKNNLNDPIAITITTCKNRLKDKEPGVYHSPDGKGLQMFSPRKQKSMPLKKSTNLLYPNQIKSNKISNKLLTNNEPALPQQTENSHNKSSCAKECILMNETMRNKSIVNSTNNLNTSNQINSPTENKSENIFKRTCYGDSNIMYKKKKSKDFNESLDNTNINCTKELYKELNESIINLDNLTKKDLMNNLEVKSVEKVENSNTDNFVSKRSPEKSDAIETNNSQKKSISNLTIKKNDRIRNRKFKPSSHLKNIDKHSFTYRKKESERIIKSNSPNIKHQEKCEGNVADFRGINDERITDIKMDQDIYCTPSKHQKTSNIIVRSSKKIEFVSTTRLDDNYSIKSPAGNEIVNSKGTEIREWVLKPITFDSDRILPKQVSIGNQGDVSRLQNTEKEKISQFGINEKPSDADRILPKQSKINENYKDVSHTTRPTTKCKIETNKCNRVSANGGKKSDSNTVPLRRISSKVSFTGCSPNSIIIARRPLNFGVSNC